MLDPGQAQVADRPVEFGDEVEVAVRSGLVAGDRANDEKRTDAKLPKVVPVAGAERDDLGATHGLILGPGSQRRSAHFGWPSPSGTGSKAAEYRLY